MGRSKVYIASASFTKIGDHWSKSILDLAVEAARSAMKQKGVPKPQEIIVGNMFSAVGA